jgi:hypothetical protein
MAWPTASISEGFNRAEDGFQEFDLLFGPALTPTRGPAMIHNYLIIDDLSVIFHILQVILSYGEATASHLIANPLLVLYFLQGLTYSVAAVISWYARHRGLTACYATSSLLHGLLAACHYFHFG